MKNIMENLIENYLIRNYDKYYRLAYSYVHNETDAMDIVQEGAYKAILKSETLKNPDYANTWIYRIMINEALAFIKKHKKDSYDISAIDISQTDHYVDYDLEKAIDNLDTTDKTIIILKFYEEYTLEEIADMTGEKLNTVKSRMYRTLKKLQISLEE
ncbi:MAG: subfamily polymerase sigma-24 factor [Herbinix sp.]|nr:subfamily polymerase sigma-24 factor [Herbinix sp.]